MCISGSHHQRGLTLIELIMFIVIVGVALAGILTVFNVTTRSSTDPMIRKQMLAIAEAVLEEVQLQPFTWCDPDDANAATATSATVGVGGCTATVEAMGPEAGETRGSATTPFDNVNDYNGLAGITTSITGGAMPSGYSAAVSVTQNALNGIAATESLRITVTVTHGTDSLALEGYRTRHSPNLLP
jgi:MSHA pilin protein MshD